MRRQETINVHKNVLFIKDNAVRHIMISEKYIQLF